MGQKPSVAQLLCLLLAWVEFERPARFVDDFRTPLGEIKRQAARFRVYAHMQDGSVREITAADARIEWRVAVANLKAGWYEFNEAMDLPIGVHDAEKRNRNLVGTMRRQRLDIVPTPRSIEGTNSGPVAFEDGAFWSNPVYLGELRTDSEGRLIFLGGKGTSKSFRPGLRPLTFANNDGWHDDVCDGPVRATVTFPGGRTMAAVPGYVAVTPPNYAPGLFGVVTIDDAVREVFQDKTWIAAPTTTSFTRDIWPIFDRLTGLQWVNHGLFVAHGFGSALDARDPTVIGRMNDTSAAAAAWRGSVLALFRDPAATGNLEPTKAPQIYGDAIDSSTAAAAQLAVTKTQHAHLRRWASGTFINDWPGTAPTARPFVDLSPAEQVEHLERASLHDCLGGPFHPAMEVTWVIRIPHLWSSAYRLKVLPDDAPAKQNFGNVLTPAACTGPGGPFDGVAAGALTRFLGVPWQTDHTSCNSSADYAPSAFLSMPTFWGARAPDQVLAHGNYLRAATLSRFKAGAGPHPAERQMQQQALKHIMHREDWLRDVRGFDYYNRLANMVEEWAELGMVLPVENQIAELPDVEMRVEQGRNEKNRLIDDTRDPKYQLTEAIEGLYEQPPSIAALRAGLPARPVSPILPPPKRTYKQGEI